MSLETTSEAVASGAGDAVSSPAPEVTNLVTNSEIGNSGNPAVASTPSTEAAKPSMEDTLRKAYRDSKRERGPDGKFAAKSPDAAEPTPGQELAEALTAPQEPAKAEAPTPEAAPLDQALSPIEAPRNLTATQKAEFAKLPRQAQEVLATVVKTAEAEVTKRAQESAEVRKQLDAVKRFADPLHQALSPFGQYLGQVAQSIGTPVPQMLAGLVKTEATLRTGTPEQKRATLYEIATTYGVPLDGQAPEANALMGTIAQLRQELGQVKGYLSEQHRAQAEYSQQEQMATQGELQRTISDFSKDKPHFEAVRPVMASLLHVGAVETLQDAYDRAVYADPTIRQALEVERGKAEEAKRQAAAKAKAEEARKAAAANVRSAPPSPPKPKSWDDSLRAKAAELYRDAR
jgi:nicotinamide mononucleotide adenylyltransferase